MIIPVMQISISTLRPAPVPGRSRPAAGRANTAFAGSATAGATSTIERDSSGAATALQAEKEGWQQNVR